jgi:CRISPR-associated exonuclease Cas4
MEDYDQIDVLISAIEHYSYCPRQCALIHIEQTYDENVYTLRGRLAHERVDSGDGRPNRGTTTQRGIPLWSAWHGLRGKADVVEWHNGVPFPVEYKVGRRKGSHPDVQLCAQALCLEEMLGIAVPQGAIYYASTRKRNEITFDEDLRAHTLTLIAAIREMLYHQHLPAAPNDSRCARCSLLTSCMPAVVSDKPRLRRMQQALFRLPDNDKEGT